MKYDYTTVIITLCKNKLGDALCISQEENNSYPSLYLKESATNLLIPLGILKQPQKLEKFFGLDLKSRKV